MPSSRGKKNHKWCRVVTPQRGVDCALLRAPRQLRKRSSFYCRMTFCSFAQRRRCRPSSVAAWGLVPCGVPIRNPAHRIDGLLQRPRQEPSLLRRPGRFALQGPYGSLRGVYACQGARNLLLRAEARSADEPSGSCASLLSCAGASGTGLSCQTSFAPDQAHTAPRVPPRRPATRTLKPRPHQAFFVIRGEGGG